MLARTVDKNKFVRAAIAGMTVIVALAAAAIWRSASPAAGAATGGPRADAAPVRTALVRQGPVEIWLATAGTVLTPQTVVLRTRVDSQINRVAFREGQMVRRGELLFELDPLPFKAALAAAKAQRRRDAALLENARLDLRRYQTLLKADSISAQTRDTTRATVQQLQATVAFDEAQIDLARLNLSYTSIRAPFSGRIGARLVDPGNLVHTTDPGGLAVIDQMQPIYVSFSVPQSRLADVRAARHRGPVPVTVKPPDGRAGVITGNLVFIDNQVDPATGSVHCKAEFSNRAMQLWPGQYVATSIRLRVVPQALTVPSAAIQSGPDGEFAYVVSQDLIARRRAVRTLDVENGRTLIDSGLRRGERVVTEGQFRLDAATPVSIQPH